MASFRNVFFVALLLALGLPSAALAQRGGAEAEAERDPNDPRTLPLRPFTAAQVALLEPLFASSVVSHIEHYQRDRLPAILLGAEVRAPAARIYQLLTHPEGYARMMPAVSEVRVRSRHGDTVGFDWAWQAAMFRLRGENQLTAHPPPEGHPERGYRINVVATGGDLGVGRTVWRILPRGADRSLVLFAIRLDLRDSSYLARQMSSASHSINRSLNMALAFAMVRGLRRHAEGRSRTGTATLGRPQVDLAQLDRLLGRGDLVWVTPPAAAAAGEAALPQVNLLTRVPHAEERVRRLMNDPVAFSEALIQGSTARVIERSEEQVRFAWQIEMPVLGSSGEMRLVDGPREVELSATEGALHGGTWRFATHTIRPRETVVLGWSRFDVADASFLLRAVIDSDPAFRDGLSASMDLAMARAMRIRLTRPLPRREPPARAAPEGSEPAEQAEEGEARAEGGSARPSASSRRVTLHRRLPATLRRLSPERLRALRVRRTRTLGSMGRIDRGASEPTPN